VRRSCAGNRSASPRCLVRRSIGRPARENRSRTNRPDRPDTLGSRRCKSRARRAVGVDEDAQRGGGAAQGVGRGEKRIPNGRAAGRGRNPSQVALSLSKTPSAHGSLTQCVAKGRPRASPGEGSVRRRGKAPCVAGGRLRALPGEGSVRCQGGREGSMCGRGEAPSRRFVRVAVSPGFPVQRKSRLEACAGVCATNGAQSRSTMT